MEKVIIDANDYLSERSREFIGYLGELQQAVDVVRNYGRLAEATGADPLTAGRWVEVEVQGCIFRRWEDAVVRMNWGADTTHLFIVGYPRVKRIARQLGLTQDRERLAKATRKLINKYIYLLGKLEKKRRRVEEESGRRVEYFPW